jgi:hypothetical protein
MASKETGGFKEMIWNVGSIAAVLGAVALGAELL